MKGKIREIFRVGVYLEEFIEGGFRHIYSVQQASNTIDGARHNLDKLCKHVDNFITENGDNNE